MEKSLNSFRFLTSQANIKHDVALLHKPPSWLDLAPVGPGRYKKKKKIVSAELVEPGLV